MQAEEKPDVTATSEFQVGAWTVRPTSNELLRDGEIVQIEPKVMALLVYLATSAGQVISREQLFNTLWSGVYVGDDTLTQVVIKLRKALGDDAKSARYVQTIPKKGYRLSAPVQAAPLSGSQATGSQAPVSKALAIDGTDGPRIRSFWRLAAILAVALAIGLVGTLAWLFSGQQSPDVQAVAPNLASGSDDGRPTISVLPFEQVGETAGGAEDQTKLAQVLTLDLITDLSKLSGLWVIGPRSVLGQATSEGADAQARYLVSGNVQRTPGEVRIYARLIDTHTGRQLWSERYRRPPQELFHVQEQISRQIVTALSLKITETEHRRLAQRYTRNLDAYESFLQGQSLLLVRQHAENDRARERYRRAIALDPNFGRAYAGLALTFAADYRNQWTDDPAAALERAREMAQTALQIDPEIPEVYWVLAYVSAQRRDRPKALSLLRKAISVDQSFADAYALMGGIETYIGRPTETLELLRAAIRLNPDAGYLYFLLLGRAYFYLGDWEQARINLNEALVHNPKNLEAHVYLMATAESSGDHDTAAWEAEEIRALEPEFAPRRWLATYPMTDVQQQEQLLAALSAAAI
jgi:DNA-binding winged helix-turn-helix (wHTH) protein/TolB-like protein/Flp pilus assembly protein TadD